jgi:hypothetical protein
MTTNGLSLKHQSDTLVANIRGRPARDVTILKPARVELAQRASRAIPVPSLELASVTRAAGTNGRIRVTLAGRSIGAQLDWEPGSPSVELDRPWVVLQPDVSRRATPQRWALRVPRRGGRVRGRERAR